MTETPEEQRKRWQETSPYWTAVSDATRQDNKHVAPSAERNVEPISARLAERLPAEGRALEVASGTGQHVVAFARRLPGIEWTPSDPHPAARRSVEAWIAESGLANVFPPLDLDVTAADWDAAVEPGLDVIVAINLLHISPWTACQGLLAGAGRLLKPGGVLCTYGCFKRGGRLLSSGNAEFDRSLKYRDPSWGVRAVEDVAAEADSHGLKLAEAIDMPANNLMLVLTPR